MWPLSKWLSSSIIGSVGALLFLLPWVSSIVLKLSPFRCFRRFERKKYTRNWIWRVWWWRQYRHQIFRLESEMSFAIFRRLSFRLHLYEHFLSPIVPGCSKSSSSLNTLKFFCNRYWRVCFGSKVRSCGRIFGVSLFSSRWSLNGRT